MSSKETDQLIKQAQQLSPLSAAFHSAPSRAGSSKSGSNSPKHNTPLRLHGDLYNVDQLLPLTRTLSHNPSLRQPPAGGLRRTYSQNDLPNRSFLRHRFNSSQRPDPPRRPLSKQNVQQQQLEIMRTSFLYFMGCAVSSLLVFGLIKLFLWIPSRFIGPKTSIAPLHRALMSFQDDDCPLNRSSDDVFLLPSQVYFNVDKHRIVVRTGNLTYKIIVVTDRTPPKTSTFRTEINIPACIRNLYNDEENKNMVLSFQESFKTETVIYDPKAPYTTYEFANHPNITRNQFNEMRDICRWVMVTLVVVIFIVGLVVFCTKEHEFLSTLDVTLKIAGGFVYSLWISVVSVLLWYFI